MSQNQKLTLFLLCAILLTPLGLISEYSAWGEWEAAEFEKMIGFVPAGIKEGGVFEAPFPDYVFAPLGEIGGYIFSAVLGSICMIAVFYGLKVLNAKK